MSEIINGQTQRIQSPHQTETEQNQFTHLLQNQMQQVGISSFKALAKTAGVSERQIIRLRRGEVQQMRVETLLKLTPVLKVSLSELIATFSVVEIPQSESAPAYAQLKQEYQRLQQQLEQQQQTIRQEVQQSSLQVLESLLVQLPTATQKAQENPQLPAVRLLPLLRPLTQLLQQWGVDAIAPVGAELAYNPQEHQLLEGTAQPGDPVKVRYTGYRQGEKLLYRAQVSPL